MSYFVKLGDGGAVTWKEPSATVGDLPPTGNQVGDARIVISPASVYVWDGSSWQNVSSGGGGSPGGVSGTVQFNDSGNFDGDSQFQWNETNKFINLNGLAIKALSASTSLVDAQASPVTAFSYSATSYNFTIIEYSITRNTSKQVGMLFVSNDASSAALSNGFANLSDVGVELSASVSAGNVNIQYTTTATGFNAFLKYAIRQWI